MLIICVGDTMTYSRDPVISSGANLVSWSDARESMLFGPQLLPALISQPKHYGMMSAEEVEKRGRALIAELAGSGEDVDALASWPVFTSPPRP